MSTRGPVPQRFQFPRLSSAHPHLDVFIREEVLDKCPVNLGHARVMDSKAIGQQVLQLQVLGRRERTGEEVSLLEGLSWRGSKSPSAKTLLLAQSTETQAVTLCPVKQYRQAALEDARPMRTEPATGRNEGPGPTPHLALLSFCPENSGGGRALSQKETQRVLLQAHVPDGPGRLPGLLSGSAQTPAPAEGPVSRGTAPTATPTPGPGSRQQGAEAAPLAGQRLRSEVGRWQGAHGSLTGALKTLSKQIWLMTRTLLLETN